MFCNIMKRFYFLLYIDFYFLLVRSHIVGPKDVLTSMIFLSFRKQAACCAGHSLQRRFLSKVYIYSIRYSFWEFNCCEKGLSLSSRSCFLHTIMQFLFLWRYFRFNPILYIRKMAERAALCHSLLHNFKKYIRLNFL